MGLYRQQQRILNMSMKRTPLDVKVGDKVTSKQLRDNGLVSNATKSVLHNGKRTWTVTEVNVGETTINSVAKGKKKPKTIGITRIVLQAKVDGKLKTTRTFWWNK